MPREIDPGVTPPLPPADLGPASGRGSSRSLWAVAWPVMVALLLENASELIDVALVGRLGGASLAAVGYGSSLIHLLVTLLQGVAAAAVGALARSAGAGSLERARRQLTATLWLMVPLAGAYALVVGGFAPLLLERLGASAAVVVLGTPYLRLSLLGSFLVAIPFALESGLRARRDTRRPLVLAVLAVTLKTGVTAALMFGVGPLPALGLVGAGLGSVFAYAALLAGYLLVCFRDVTPGRPFWPVSAGARAEVGPLLRLAAPALGERLAMNVALLAYFVVLSRYGDAAIAAYAVGVRVLTFTWLPGLGFGVAASALVGQALGGGSPSLARRAGWRGMQLALGVMAMAALLCVALREPLARVFTRDPQVLEHLLPFLLMLAVAQPFMGVHFTLAGALRGAGDTWTPLLGATVGNWALRVPLAWLAARAGLPPVFAWGALVLDHVARAVWYLVAWQRGAWQTAHAARSTQ